MEVWNPFWRRKCLTRSLAAQVANVLNNVVLQVANFSRGPGSDYGWIWRCAYLVMAGALVVMGLARRFTLPLVPIFDADSPNYLWPALLKLNGDGFVHNAGLNFLYPGWLFVLLRIFSDFRAIIVFQHLLGVAAGIFLLLGWNRLHALDPAPFLRKAVHEAIGLFGAGIYLLSPIPVLFELHIRPEALCLSVQLLSFWLIAKSLFHRRAANRRKIVAYGMAAVASAFLLCSLKPSYTLTALLVIAFVSWIILRAGLSWKLRAIFFAGVVVTALVFFVPERLLARGDRLTKMFLPETLFSVHANIIRDQIGDDLARGAPVPFPRRWLQPAYEDLGVEVSRARVVSPSPFSLLGFNPDFLMNGEHAIFNRWLEQLRNDDELERFLTYYYWRALRHRPFSFSAKIAREFGVFYRWDCPAFAAHQRIPLVAWHYGQSILVIKEPENWEQIGKTVAGGRLLAQTEELLSRETMFNSGKRVAFYHSVLARSYLPGLMIGVGLALWVLLVRKPSGQEQWPSLLLIFLFVLNFGNVLAISTVHSMEVLRYSTVQFSAALVAELWTIRYLLEFILRLFERKTRRL